MGEQMDSMENIYVKMMLGFAEKGIANNPPRDGDYEVDGILTCGKCNKPRRRYQKIGNDDVLVWAECDCDKEKRLAEEAENERKEKEKRVTRLRERSKMDSKYMCSAFDKLIITEYNKKPIGVCKRYAEKFEELRKKGQGLLLYGNVGTGKTEVAACIANYLMEETETPVIMTSFVVLLKEIQKLSSYDVDDTEEEYIARMNNFPLWVIDDLGTERDTTYALEKVYGIVDSRYRTGKPVIYTTNVSLDEIMNTTDLRYKRIYDRILEQCYPVEFAGPSWRMKEAKKRFSDMSELLGDNG